MALDALSQTLRRAWSRVFRFSCVRGAGVLTQTFPSAAPAPSTMSIGGPQRFCAIRISETNYGVRLTCTTGLRVDQNLVFACHGAVYDSSYCRGSECI